MISSVTRLRVRRFWDLPAFLWTTFLVQRQISRVSGFIGGQLLIDRKRAYWTLTVWENERAMKAFRGSAAHAKAMPKLLEWCDEAAYAHWESEQDRIAKWEEAYEHLVKEGRLSHVAYPSSDHTSRHFVEPRLKPLIGRKLKSAQKRYPAA